MEFYTSTAVKNKFTASNSMTYSGPKWDKDNGSVVIRITRLVFMQRLIIKLKLLHHNRYFPPLSMIPPNHYYTTSRLIFLHHSCGHFPHLFKMLQLLPNVYLIKPADPLPSGSKLSNYHILPNSLSHLKHHQL